MDLISWIKRTFSSELAHHEHLPAREAVYGRVDPPLPEPLARALKSLGVERLYSHQAEAVGAVRAGQDVLVATPTASGKSLIYNLPVFESILRDDDTRALYLFPLKALAQDQLRMIQELSFGAASPIRAAVYDGDTPPAQRNKLRARPPHILLSNPDMLHHGLLAHHEGWVEFWQNLKYVVIDEVHTYRGIFGSHVAQILRRLQRICRQAGARPQYLFSSATVHDPGAFVQALAGREFTVIEKHGAPVAGRDWCFLNPDLAGSTVAARLLEAGVRQGYQTIVFTRSRRLTELITMWVMRSAPDLAGRIASYRAGFLPEERRGVEARLASGQLAGVISTSALEMGIDIGHLDVCVLVGYPGTIINTWQRAGRVGRAGRESAVVLIAGADALDQFFVHNPADFFGRSYETAVLDPDNSHVVAEHLVCAAAERPLDPGEPEFDLERHASVLVDLARHGKLLQEADGDRWFAGPKRPHRRVNIRGAGDTFVISLHGSRQVVGHIDGGRALKECHPGAIYLHQADQYEVTGLDLKSHRVTVRPKSVGYFTRVLTDKQTEVLSELKRRPVKNFLIHLGRLKVTETVVGYEKRRISGQELLGTYDLDLPPQKFETVGLWIDVSDALRRLVAERDGHFMGSIHALEHAAIAMFPLFALCDRHDVGGIAYPRHPQTGQAAVFIYDGHAGGVGLSERGFEIIEDLLQKTLALVRDCGCEIGCPSCIHSPKCGSGNKPLDKAGAMALLEGLLGEVALPIEDGPRVEAPPRKKKSGPRPTGLRYGFFDLETLRLADEVGGWGNIHLMGLAVAVVYDQAADEFTEFGEQDVEGLVEKLSSFDVVVGFNVRRFDYTVLSGYIDYDFAAVPTLDMLDDVFEILRFRLSLDHLATENLGTRKSGDGLQAVAWWRAGDRRRVVDYCQQDVALTRDLFLLGAEQGYLVYRDRNNNRLRLPVDWSEPAVRSRFLAERLS
ncbi:MAG: DEAD/DEAH box helicase [Proteobacteria bacterium]|nr:DEAD/DEAH box helicase [Pseudomonadota bacterium]MBU1742914.1 DEAD/DEAH box helicase [Pseudomonadota bacterium]